MVMEMREDDSVFNTLGDPGADNGARESWNVRKKECAKKNHFFFTCSNFPLPHYLPLGLRGCFLNCLHV